MAGMLSNVLKAVLPRTIRAQGNAHTNTYSADQRTQVLSGPTYREHTTDIFNTRQSEDSRSLLKSLFTQDPDVSATVNAYLTTADTKPIFKVLDLQGGFDRAGQQALNEILTAMTTRFDYAKGFDLRPSIAQLSENMRYMLLLRGAIGAELVFDKAKTPSEIRLVDMSTIEWFETEPNHYVPKQIAPASSQEISLDVPTFMVSFFRRDPTSIYTYSPFVSAINTIAARQQVINDLYRIMQITGFPRIEAVVLEEVLIKNAPAEVRANPEKQQAYVNNHVLEVQNWLASNPRPDQAVIHTDSVELRMLNERAPGAALNVDSVIAALNAMNQAGLRVMATILGRGESGVNTASVEARIFSMNADSLNQPVADMWSQLLTMALRVVTQTDSYVKCSFRPVELRPETELEAQYTMRAARLRQDLSDGIISDDEYHLEMYGRIRPDSAPELSGTGFMSKGGSTIEVDAKSVTPNDDPMGRSLTPENSDAARSNGVTKTNARGKKAGPAK